jgi:GT2 family glycosyltransferase
MLSVTIVLFRPKSIDFSRTVESLLANAKDVASVHILVSGTRKEFSAIESLMEELSRATKCFMHHRFDNLGFASGHNFLLEQAFQFGADAALVLNPDVVLEPESLRRLAAITKLQRQTILLGPTLSLATEGGVATQTFDSAGIDWTNSGRHFDKFQGDRWKIHSGQQDVVSGVTGACLVVGRNSFEQIRSESGHFFDDLFLAYREDAELGIRASELGIPSAIVHMEGFAHVRSVRGYERGNRLADLLGVRNRFLLRWSLGSLRPGNPLVAGARDGLVILASLLVERSSLPGLRDALAIRRYASYRGRSWRRTAARKAR